MSRECTNCVSRNQERKLLQCCYKYFCHHHHHHHHHHCVFIINFFIYCDYYFYCWYYYYYYYYLLLLLLLLLLYIYIYIYIFFFKLLLLFIYYLTTYLTHFCQRLYRHRTFYYETMPQNTAHEPRFTHSNVSSASLNIISYLSADGEDESQMIVSLLVDGEESMMEFIDGPKVKYIYIYYFMDISELLMIVV